MVEEIITGKEEGAGGAGQPKPGNNDIPAGGQPGVAQGAAGNQNKEAEGFKSAYEAEKTKRQEAEAATAQVQQQMQIMSANAQPGQQTQQPTSMFMQAAKSLGFDPEFMTPAETGQVMDTLMQYMAQNQQSIAFDTSHSDFSEVVGKMVNNVFQESPHLQKVFDTNPELRQAFRTLGLTPSTKLIAYQMVKNSPEYQAAQTTEDMTEEQKAAAEAEAKIKAANSQASISSVPGGGNLDRGAAVAAMNDAEFKVELDKKMSEAT